MMMIHVQMNVETDMGQLIIYYNVEDAMNHVKLV